MHNKAIHLHIIRFQQESKGYVPFWNIKIYRKNLFFTFYYGILIYRANDAECSGKKFSITS